MRNPIRALAIAVPILAVCLAPAAAADRTQTTSGTISRLDAPHQALVVKVGDEEVKFVWNADTRINGILSQGAKVTVRYATQPDGQNLAFQISVGR
jgi:hypothetical protein